MADDEEKRRDTGEAAFFRCNGSVLAERIQRGVLPLLRGLLAGPPAVFFRRAFRRSFETGYLPGHPGTDRPRQEDRAAAGGADGSARFHY